MKRILILLTAGLFLFACNTQTKSDTSEEPSGTEIAADLFEVVLNVEGMTCDGCENAIQKSIESLDGIAMVESSHEEGWTKVKFDKSLTSQAAVEEKITETGYTVKGVRGEEEAPGEESSE